MARLSLEAKIMKKDDARYSIDSAISAYNFLDEIGGKDAVLVLENGLKSDVSETMLTCIKIICKSVDQLNVK